MFQNGAFVPKREGLRRAQRSRGCSVLVFHKLRGAFRFHLVDRVQLILPGQTRPHPERKGTVCPKGR
jgi:hypothetical protein